MKPTASAKALLPTAEYQIPYPGAKEMLLVDAIEDRKLMAELLEAMYPELAAQEETVAAARCGGTTLERQRTRTGRGTRLARSLVEETSLIVGADDAYGLKVCIDHGSADELHATLLQVLRNGIRQRR